MKNRSEKVRETFAFELGSEELLAKGQEASSLNREIADKNYRLAIYKKERKAEIDNLQSKLNQVLKVIDLKKEDRTVEVDKVYNYDDKVITYMFRGEILRDRPMDQFELQTQLETTPLHIAPQS